MSEQFISGEIDGKQFNAFVTSNKSATCKDGSLKHRFNELALGTNKGRTITRITYPQYAYIVDDRYWHRLIIEKLESEMKDECITSGSTICVHCGIGYMQFDNPNYYE